MTGLLGLAAAAWAFMSWFYDAEKEHGESLATPGRRVYGAGTKDLRELRIGVALSGGGFRATLHSLGALMYLVDAGVNKQVECIASVSGGSIANGYIAQQCHYRHVKSDEFDQIVGGISRAIVHRGLIPSVPVYLYGALILLLAIASAAALAAVIVQLLGRLAEPALAAAIAQRLPKWPGAAWAAAWFAYWPWGWAGTSLTFGILVVALLTAGLLRGHVLSYLLQRRIFSGTRFSLQELDQLTREHTIRSGTRAGLKIIEDLALEHVFCATDLNHGVPVFLSSYGGGKIYCDALGWGRAGHIGLCDAVRASAALPGGFPPRRLSTKKCKFGGPATGWSGVPRVQVLYLADGGIWNNLATHWWNLRSDKSGSPGPSRYSTFDWSMERVIHEEAGRRNVVAEMTRTNQPDLLLIINSKASAFHLTPTFLLGIPFVAELVALKRDMDTIYENSVDPRVEALEELEAAALLKEDRFPITKVGDLIPDIVPIVVTLGRYYKWGQLTTNTRLAHLTWLRAREETFKNYREGAWWDRAMRRIVPTTLGRIDEDTAVELLVDGYVGAMGGLTTFLGLGVPAKLSQDRFRQLVRVVDKTISPSN